VIAAAVFASAVLGCGENNRAEVEGTVTLDGKPFAEGHITFIPTGDTKGPVAGATILEGQYRVPSAKGVQIGTNRVEIRGVRATGRKIPFGPGMIDEFVEAIPPKYNEKSELQIKTQAGTNRADFDLHSQP
jgi:hypothetical protein